MRTYKCHNCSFTFSDAEKDWDAAVDSGRCPKCREELHHFPVPVQKARPITKQPYPWGTLISWVSSAFLLGFVGAVRQLRSDTVIGHFGTGVAGGILCAVIVGLTAGTIKYWNRNPNFSIGAALNTRDTDKVVFYFSVGLAIFFLVKALVFKQYGAVADAVVCGLLGVGVQRDYAPARWSLAVYAFINPFVVILLGGLGGSIWIWPLFFFAVCQSIVAHRKETQSASVSFDASMSRTSDLDNQKI